MPAKSKVKKGSAPKRRIVRSKPKINLLKNTNLLVLVGGFVTILITVFLISNNSTNYDLRSRGQTLPSSSPSIVLPSGAMPGVPSAVCLGNCPPDGQEEEEIDVPGGHQPCDPAAGNCANRGKGDNDDQNQEPDQDQDPDQNQNPDPDNPDPDNPDGDNPDEGDADKGHGNDPDGVDEDNPGKGLGGPNAEKNNPDVIDNWIDQLMQQIDQLVQRLLALFGGGQVPPIDENPNPVPSTAPSGTPSGMPSGTPSSAPSTTP